MCSIIGYLGKDMAAPKIVNGLKRMEYRGYDSVGVATVSPDEKNRIIVKKGVGKVVEVNKSLNLEVLSGNAGVGHTRWATHGGVTNANAHPHSSNSGSVAIVHNGIVENYKGLKENLTKEGYVFKSDTDTEVIANLLQKNYRSTNDIKKTIEKSVSEIKGNYAFVAMFDDGTLCAARFHEPLIIGIGKEGYYIASDVLGFVEYTDDVIYLGNKEFAVVTKDYLQVYDFEGNTVKHSSTKVSKELADVYKGDYAHFTLKEISEQPSTILKAAEDTQQQLELASDYIKHAKSLYVTGSGSSYNAALVAKHLLAKYSGIKAEPIISSEIPYSPDIDPHSILIAISQSGESADVLEGVRIAKERSAKIISIVNIMTSSLVNESSISIGLNCGPEIGVAATKSFTSQLGVIYKIADALCHGCMNLDFNKASQAIMNILENSDKIKEIASKLKEISDIYVLGRGIHFPIACEGALKIKELSYIHAEGLPGGELKHGSLALMDPNVYVIIINPNDNTYSDTLSSAHEIKARGAKIIGISDKNDKDVYDYWIPIPELDESIYPLAEVIPIQLLAYYSAIEKNTDPDYPRNLAKSVTVK